jgi:hypothetical protein
MGYFAVCLDPENNGFGLWEDNPRLNNFFFSFPFSSNSEHRIEAVTH